MIFEHWLALFVIALGGISLALGIGECGPPRLWFSALPNRVTFPPDAPSSYLRDVTPYRPVPEPEETDALFDVSDAGLHRHLLGMILSHVPNGTPEEELDFYMGHAEACMYLGFDDLAYDCARDGCSYAFQINQQLRPPKIERRRVPVVQFPRSFVSPTVH